MQEEGVQDRSAVTTTPVLLIWEDVTCGNPSTELQERTCFHENEYNALDQRHNRYLSLNFDFSQTISTNLHKCGD